jgi:energy-coupling factor transporter transmembrane protein EcfT
MLAFFPDAFLAWIINTILIVGIVGFIASFFFGFVVRWIPTIAPYHLLIQVISIVLLVGGVYFKGGYSVEMAWRERVAELEAKIAISEQKSKEVNEKIITVYKDRVKVVKETQVVIQEKIKEVEVKIDSQCTVDNSVIQILNDAAVRKPK